MPPGCRMTAAVGLLMLVLRTTSLEQSGDGESADMEPSFYCISHISTKIVNLTCEQVGCRIDEDDEDAEANGIQKITACYRKAKKQICQENKGDSISIVVSPVVSWNVTVDCVEKKISKMIDLRTIVKPKRPEVQNITLNQESNQVAIYIQTPYENDYIKVENQLFQVLIHSPTDIKIQNISSSHKIIMRLSMDRLQKGTKHNVKVRAIPIGDLKGTWSEWSEWYSFDTPDDEQTVMSIDWMWGICTAIVCFIIFLIMTTVSLCKPKIFTCMFPSIPHPKYTLVHICSPNTGFLLNIKPEVCSALNVCPMERTSGEQQQEPRPPNLADATDGTRSTLSCSAQSSEFSSGAASASTEELELLTQLSRSSSEAEDSIHSSSSSSRNSSCSPSADVVPQLAWRPLSCSVEDNKVQRQVGQQEEAYVTMSSFYQIK